MRAKDDLFFLFEKTERVSALTHKFSQSKASGKKNAIFYFQQLTLTTQPLFKEISLQEISFLFFCNVTRSPLHKKHVDSMPNDL